MAGIVYRFLVASAILAVSGVGVTMLALFGGWSTLGGYKISEVAFVTLFFYRYWRLVINIPAYLLYRPRLPSPTPKFNPRDCTVIVPTIDPEHVVFPQCIASIAACGPASILIVTIKELYEMTDAAVASVKPEFPNVDIQVHAHSEASKRGQIAHVLDLVNTDVTVLADSTVNWKHQTFLRHILAPFEDKSVALVGTNKRVVRESHDISTFHGLRASFFNFLGCIYLERHNFELAASACIDSGVFVISGRTCAVLTSVLKDKTFSNEYVNEHLYILGLWQIGPLVPDDDNYITRWCVANGMGVRFQHAPEAVVETVLGDYPRFVDKQCYRWARTTFRSNVRSLLTKQQYVDYPWSSYGVQLAGITNFAFLTDGLLLALNPGRAGPLVGWILATKLVKLVPHFLRHPYDLAFFPLYVLWAYGHSLFIKFWAMLTFTNIKWSGRDLDSIAQKAEAVAPEPPSSKSEPLDVADKAPTPLAEMDPNTPLVRRKGHGEAVAADDY